MKKWIIIVILSTTLMISSFFAGAVNINTLNKTISYGTAGYEDNDADLPIFEVGDNWIYNMEIKGEQSEYFNLDYDLDIDNLKFEIEEVQDELYKIKMTVPQGDLSGQGSISISLFTFSGRIQNAYLDGYLYVEKSTLKIKSCEGKIEGDTDKILLPHFNINFGFEFEGVVDEDLVKTSFSPLKFPMNVDEIWQVPFNYLNLSLDPIQPNLDGGNMYSYIDEHDVKCHSWDVINIGNNEYDALYLSGVNYGNKNDIWYSPAVGNIIKLDYDDLELGFGYIIDYFRMDLISTNYEAPSDAPETPSKPSGPTDFAVGETGEYETSADDPDGDKIRYIVDWGDGSDKTYTDFTEPGEQITLSHTWVKKGNNNLKVKARDKYGMESDWSEPLIVNVVNEAPSQPSKPSGPTSGSKGTSYTYNTSASDPDGHKIKYGWDWNGDQNVDQWTELKNSGEQVYTSHTWGSSGTYSIRVKAMDEYNEESEWSEPLSVSMPKNKRTTFSILRILQRLFDNFSTWLEHLILFIQT